jgi:hypothetical protein
MLAVSVQYESIGVCLFGGMGVIRGRRRGSVVYDKSIPTLMLVTSGAELTSLQSWVRL